MDATDRSELRVLILDDDPTVGAIVEAVAQSSGAETRLTGQAPAFFDLLSQWQPTCVILDLNMPGMSGKQVLAQLAQQGCHVPIILASGDSCAAEATRESCNLSLTIAGVLVKPFRAANLRALLNAQTGAS